MICFARLGRVAEFALLIAGTAAVIWLSLRGPDPRGRLSDLRGVICTPSIERLRSQAQLRGCGPGPVYPPEFELMPLLGIWVQLHPTKALTVYPPEFELMPLHLPPQPNPVQGNGGFTALSGWRRKAGGGKRDGYDIGRRKAGRVRY